LLKDRIAQGDELVRAIREVHAGGSVVDPSIAERLSGRRETAERDRELLDMMAKGLGYAEIAEALSTTQEAVDRQVTDLFRSMAGDGGASTSLVDELKRLHEAVVEQTESRRMLASFVPRQLAEQLASHPKTAIEPQEVVVTVLFSDIRGFSTIAERLQAREVASVVGKHLEAMAEVVAAHGGTIDKFQGDAVMAVFGAPEPLPDHAERALRCAIAMQERQAELNAVGWEVVDLPEMGVGIGVNTGKVIAGTVGGGGRLEYTVVGDAVNIASRLQNEAAGGEIVATDSTVAAAPGVICESIGTKHVKGREEPVEVFRVVLGS
jgi:class 3 adenylate cyclase